VKPSFLLLGVNKYPPGGSEISGIWGEKGFPLKVAWRTWKEGTFLRLA
jgi:hypothetical protein